MKVHPLDGFWWRERWRSLKTSCECVGKWCPDKNEVVMRVQIGMRIMPDKYWWMEPYRSSQKPSDSFWALTAMTIVPVSAILLVTGDPPLPGVVTMTLLTYLICFWARLTVEGRSQ